MPHMRHLLLPIVLTSALTSAETAPAPAPAPAPASDGPSLTDPLGGAAWKERRIEVTAGLISLGVDGYRDDQRALYLAGSAYAVAGYKGKDTVPVGAILGVGGLLKTWYGTDDVDLFAVAPFAVGVAGVFADLNDRNRLELLGRLGPGLGYASVGDNNSGIEFGWTYAIEASLTVSQGGSKGLGVGVGYEVVHFGDFEHDSVYLALRFGF